MIYHETIYHIIIYKSDNYHDPLHELIHNYARKLIGIAVEVGARAILRQTCKILTLSMSDKLSPVMVICCRKLYQ